MYNGCMMFMQNGSSVQKKINHELLSDEATSEETRILDALAPVTS